MSEIVKIIFNYLQAHFNGFIQNSISPSKNGIKPIIMISTLQTARKNKAG